jgi:ribonuclease HI
VWFKERKRKKGKRREEDHRPTAQEEMEPMYTNTASPWWEPPETHTASTKEAAIRLHRARTWRMRKRAAHALIYTDGSEI